MFGKLLALLVAFAATLGVLTLSAGSASAAGAATFGCRVWPGVATYSSQCTNGSYNSYYTVAFMVQYVDPGTTYTWSVPTEYQASITDGCTSTSYGCGLRVGRSEQIIPVSVSVNQGGVVVFRSAQAYIQGYVDDSGGCQYC